MENEIKVLHLSSEKTWRGGEQQIAYLIDMLNTSGIQNYVATHLSSAFEKYCIKRKWDFVSLPFLNALDFITAKRINQFCVENEIDLIHMHSSKSHGIAVLSALLGNKTPLILSRRVDFKLKDKWFTRFKYNYSKIKKIVCVSDKINEIVRESIKDPDKSITVHSGVDLDKFKHRKNENILRQQYNIDHSIKLVGNTSALAIHKDYITFINVIKQLLANDKLVKGIIIGEGPQDTSLKAYVVEQDLSAHIIFTGFRNDIDDILPELDVFLITSEEEGLGTSVLDAFVAQVPVVATRAGGIPEMVVHGTTGLLGDVRDVETLSAYVESILADESLKQTLIAGATKQVQKFSKEETARKTLEVYKQVLLNEDRHA